MAHSIKRPVLAGTGLLIALVCLALLGTSVTADASPAGPASASSSGATGKKAVVHDCAWATRVASLGERRYKKVRKRWRNGLVSTRKLKWARRIWKAELRQKAEICSAPPPPVTPQTPLALTGSEIINRITAVAKVECDVDNNCSDYGAYSLSDCDYITTYQAACYGWNYEGFGNGATCDFREVVSRSGYNGVSSSRDTSYGNTSGGWYCYF